MGRGDKAPNFDLETAAAALRLADLKGAKCVLYFYPKDDTAGCTKEAIDFNALTKEFAALGDKLVGVSPDTLASHDKFPRKHELELPLGADPRGRRSKPTGFGGKRACTVGNTWESSVRPS